MAQHSPLGRIGFSSGSLIQDRIALYDGPVFSSEPSKLILISALPNAQFIDRNSTVGGVMSQILGE